MKVLTVFGSPRKKGNTATVQNWVVDELKAQGHEVDQVNISDYQINGCVECFTCQTKPDEPGCPQKDDALGLFKRVIDADALIGSGLIVASVKSKESKNKHLPPALNPDDETFCISKVDGISAAGHIETEEGHGIVWGGKFKFNRPMATVSSSPFE